MKKVWILALLLVAGTGITGCHHMDQRYSGTVSYSWGDGYYDYPGYWGYSERWDYPRYPRRHHRHHHHHW